MIRVHLKIHGRVQGVYFRSHTYEKARQIGEVTGWVANNEDGTVDIIAEGPKKKIDDFVTWCHDGPISSNVKKVEIEHKEYTAEFSNFAVHY